MQCIRWTYHRVYKDTPSESESFWRCDLRIPYRVRTARAAGLFIIARTSVRISRSYASEMFREEMRRTLVFPLSLQDTAVQSPSPSHKHKLSFLRIRCPGDTVNSLEEIQPSRIHIDQHFLSIRYGRLDIVRAARGPARHVLISQVLER